MHERPPRRPNKYVKHRRQIRIVIVAWIIGITIWLILFIQSLNHKYIP